MNQKIIMNEINILKNLKQHFSKIILKTDIRINISPFKFVIGLIFSYLGDTTFGNGSKDELV
ncbi:MAG: hypothetical protein QM487_08520 [Candidatus Marithrix sp.]